MPTLEEIRAQIQNLDNASRLLGFREIRELPNILWHDERVEKLVQGFYGNGQGILVATNRRLVFVDKGLIYGLRVEDFPYGNISSIQYSTGLMFGKIIIFASGNRAVIEQVEKQLARDFADYVRARTSGDPTTADASRTLTPPDPLAETQPPPQPSTTPEDFITQLERLGKLRDQGILTDEEFAAQKKKILGS